MSTDGQIPISPEDALRMELVQKITSPGIESENEIQTRLKECNTAILKKRFVIVPDSVLDEYLKDLVGQKENLDKEIDKVVNSMVSDVKDIA